MKKTKICNHLLGNVKTLRKINVILGQKYITRNISENICQQKLMRTNILNQERRDNVVMNTNKNTEHRTQNCNQELRRMLKLVIDWSLIG